jgi:hypothetical protein
MQGTKKINEMRRNIINNALDAARLGTKCVPTVEGCVVRTKGGKEGV